MSRFRLIEWIIVVAIVATVLPLFRGSDYGSGSLLLADDAQVAIRGGWLVKRSHWKSIEKKSPLVEYLVEQHLWTPLSTNDPNWIQTAHFNARHDGQSQLHKVLYWQDGKWIEWTKEHPELAKTVWPRVLAAIRQDQSGGRAAELLQLAKGSDSLGDFERSAAILEAETKNNR